MACRFLVGNFSPDHERLQARGSSQYAKSTHRTRKEKRFHFYSCGNKLGSSVSSGTHKRFQDGGYEPENTKPSLVPLMSGPVTQWCCSEAVAWILHHL